MTVPNIETSSSTVEKSLDLLLHLHAAGRPLGLSALARALGLPRSTAHRLLAPLLRRGLLERDESGRYRMGFALVALGLGVLRGDPLVAAARPVLEEAAQALGETVFLTAARAGSIAVLEKAEGRGILRAAPQVGSTVPVHATAVGKLQLAFAPGDVQLDPGLAAYTPATPSTHEALAREIDLARRRGFAVNCDAWIPGLTVVAAPVLVDGRLVAAISIAVPSARLPELSLQDLAVRAQRTAARVAARLSAREWTEGAGGPRTLEESA